MLKWKQSEYIKCWFICILKVHHAFPNGLNCLDIDIAQFPFDIHILFKLFSEVVLIEEVTETGSVYAVKHGSVCVRFFEL